MVFLARIIFCHTQWDQNSFMRTTGVSKSGKCLYSLLFFQFIFKCFLWDINIELKSSYFQADNRKRYKEENNDHLDDFKAAEHAWQKHKQLNESIIVALFQGQFKSTVQCLTCHKKSRTFEAFMYLSLPLASTSKCTLQVSLRRREKMIYWIKMLFLWI